jgi:hypothetical protein
MKKIIFFNILITLSLFPYVMSRWISFPYSEGKYSLEIFMVYGTFIAGFFLSLTNIFLLFTLRYKKHRDTALKSVYFFLSLLFPFPVYSGIVSGYISQSVIPDIAALFFLYGNLWLIDKTYHKLFSNNNLM